MLSNGWQLIEVWCLKSSFSFNFVLLVDSPYAEYMCKSVRVCVIFFFLLFLMQKCNLKYENLLLVCIELFM